MTNKFIADENINHRVIKELRSLGYDVISVLEEYKGASDVSIIKVASETKRTLITHDTDFGNLIFRGGYTHHGVILVRLKDHNVKNVLNVLLRIIEEHEPVLTGAFIVATDDKVRVRRSIIED